MRRPGRRGGASEAADLWVVNGLDLNAALRGDEALLAELAEMGEPVDHERLTGLLDAAMRPLRPRRTLYRGVSGGRDLADVFGLERGEGLVGREFVDKGFVSTSTDPSVARHFGNAATLRIHPRRGVPHLDLEDLNDQKEVLLGRNLHHRITGEEVVDGRRFIDVEVARPGRRARARWPWIFAVATVLLVGSAAVMVAALAALVGATAPCLVGGTASASGPRASGAARQFPPARLHLYMGAARRFDISWPFLASIGVQECGYDGHCGLASSGCAGVMEIAYVRGSDCSPDPSVPTIWERYKVDADGGGADIFDPADAIFTAARILRTTMGAPPAGGSYQAYHEAACNYYGACADGVADYADEVMARAVEFGFGHEGGGGSSRSVSRAGARVETEGLSASGEGTACGGGSVLPSGRGPMGPVHKASAPRHLAPLPVPPASSPGIECDARIIPDVLYLARRFGLLVTACYGIHATDGEHPLGAAIDAVPSDDDWDRTMRAALAIGWHPSCAASGVAPGCARPPFRFIGYNGYPDHGDPAHCSPCAGGAHLHISWNTSASLGEPENRPRYTYEPAAWIEVFATGGPRAEDEVRPAGKAGDREVGEHPAGAGRRP